MQAHNPYAPGLHHLCLRVESEAELVEIGRQFQQQGITVDNPVPQHYPEYAPDYYALFTTDPDGLRIEVTNYRQERRQRHDHWEAEISE
jgi:catechol 2,3-dioxygenase-like lactoylglutathione lyase family enzyme